MCPSRSFLKVASPSWRADVAYPRAETCISKGT